MVHINIASPHFSIFNTALHAISTKQTKEVNICISRPFLCILPHTKAQTFLAKGHDHNA